MGRCIRLLRRVQAAALAGVAGRGFGQWERHGVAPYEEPIMAKPAKTDEPITDPKPQSKQQQLILLLTRNAGATLDQMVELTGWLPHTTRAALTFLKKRGYEITSDKVEGVRTYRANAREASTTS